MVYNSYTKFITVDKISKVSQLQIKKFDVSIQILTNMLSIAFLWAILNFENTNYFKITFTNLM